METPGHGAAECTPAAAASPQRAELSLWDAVSLMIGIVVGTSLFVSPRLVFGSVPSAGAGLLTWAVGGVLSTIGALLFAELAVSFPRGGAYTYLTAAFGRTAGLIYGVALVTVMLTANIGAMAFVFARYGRSMLPDAGSPAGDDIGLGPMLAAGAVLVLAIFNSRGLQAGRRTQNLLTGAKLLGLGLIVAAGLTAQPVSAEGLPVSSGVSQAPPVDFAFAMVIVLYAFGGWSDAATVAAEVRNRSRNIPRALVGGLAGVTLIYLAVNYAYVHGIGFDGIRQSSLPARDVAIAAGWGEWAGRGVSVLVMISALGAVQGMLFSGSRAVAALGADHAAFRGLGRWNEANHVPVGAIWTLAGISLLQIGLVGTDWGHRLVNQLLSAVRVPPVAWENFDDGFDVLVYGSAPTFWALMLGVGAAFLVLRGRRQTPTGFRAPGGPVVPAVYVGTCAFMLWRATDFAGALGAVGLAACALGAAIAVATRPRSVG